MNNLTSRLQRVQCGLHNCPIQYLCIDQNCQHQFKGLCMLCFNGDQIDNHYDLRNIVAFLSAEKQQRTRRLRRFKFKLMYFLTCVLRINVEAIHEYKMVGNKQLEGILQCQDNMNQLYQLCRQKIFTQECISELGMFISRLIVIQTVNSITEIMATLLTNQVNDTEAYCQSTKFTMRSPLLQRKWKVQTQYNISNQVIKRKPLYRQTQIVELGNYSHIMKFSSDESQIWRSSYGQINRFDFVRNKVKRSSQVTLRARQEFISYLCQNQSGTFLVAVCISDYAIIYQKHSSTGNWKQLQILHTLLHQGGSYATFSDDSRYLAIAKKNYVSKLLIHSNSNGKWRLFKAIQLNFIYLDMFYNIDQSFVIVSKLNITKYDHQFKIIQTIHLNEITHFIPFISFQINKQLNTIIQAFYQIIQIIKLDNLTKQWSKQMIHDKFIINTDSTMVISRCSDLLTVWKYDCIIGKWKLYQRIRQVGGLSKDVIVSKDFTTILISYPGVIRVFTLEDIK